MRHCTIWSWDQGPGVISRIGIIGLTRFTSHHSFNPANSIIRVCWNRIFVCNYNTAYLLLFGKSWILINDPPKWGIREPNKSTIDICFPPVVLAFTPSNSEASLACWAEWGCERRGNKDQREQKRNRQISGVNWECKIKLFLDPCVAGGWEFLRLNVPDQLHNEGIVSKFTEASSSLTWAISCPM